MNNMREELKNSIEKALEHAVLQEAVNRLTEKQAKYAEMLCENIEMKDDKGQRWKFYYKTPEESKKILKEMLGARKEREYHGTGQY
ncbi:MAG: hypothetical protein WCH62_09190, partial [Candidatus Omnitrophota bacterium]